ncbi:unnamed protein product [Peronospora destructor]|uniref:Major facilitator superfamily (MFS) profile domain-containing protein n=1 Tax=Peronospora destructor TaxID=86335 RepID=A0AAV0TVB7_9STRA|nr:unnamed protein product [Peronospora destructor]
MAVAKTFVELLVGRVVVGVEIGCSSMTVPLYITEASPPQIRRQLVSLYSASITGGQFFGSVLDALLADTEKGWRFVIAKKLTWNLQHIEHIEEDTQGSNVEVSNHRPWAAWPPAYACQKQQFLLCVEHVRSLSGATIRILTKAKESGG